MELYIDIFFIGLLIVVSIVDIYENKIPDSLCIGIFLLGVVSELVTGQLDFKERIVGFLAVSIPLFIIDLFISGGIGGGDIKFMAASGFLLGYSTILKAAVIGVVIAGVWALGSVVIGRKSTKDYLPLGPCFSIGIILSMQ